LLRCGKRLASEFVGLDAVPAVALYAPRIPSSGRAISAISVPAHRYVRRRRIGGLFIARLFGRIEAILAPTSEHMMAHRQATKPRHLTLPDHATAA
jgi:hypothetical protein